MTTLTDNHVAIDEIEEKLSELGYETEFSSDDDGTCFTISVGDKELSIYDGVSGDWFRPEHVTHAEYLFGIMCKDVTEKFEESESIFDFMHAVQEAMAINFMPR